MKNLFIVFILVLGFEFAYADQGQCWNEMLETSASCQYEADFFTLTGFPFGKLEIVIEGEKKVIPMLQEPWSPSPSSVSPDCFVNYSSIHRGVTPEIPTYRISSTDVCMGRLPEFLLTVSYSGVQKKCEMVQK